LAAFKIQKALKAVSHPFGVTHRVEQHNKEIKYKSATPTKLIRISMAGYTKKITFATTTVN
jgi:hypothetical protein